MSSSADFIGDGLVVDINANIPESYTDGSKVMNDLNGNYMFNSAPGVAAFLNDGGRYRYSAGNNN